MLLSPRVQVLVLVVIAIGMGVACTPMNGPQGQTGTATFSGEAAAGGNGEIRAIPNTKTAGISSGNRVLRNMVSCLGTRTPSTRATNAYNDKVGNFAAEGWANTVTAPMMMAYAAVSAEVCLDLVTAEKALAANDRRIFGLINFGAGPSALSEAGIADTVRRLARSCWGRNETQEELTLIRDSVRSNFTSNNTADTDKSMFFVCSAMLSSLSGIEM